MVLDALGYRDATDIEPLTGGWDTHLWRFEADGRALVLRVYRPTAPLEALAPVAANEVAAMRAAQAGGLPVPEVVREAAFDGAPALVLSWMPGEPLADVLKRKPWQMRSWGREFGRLQARLHRCDVSGVRLLAESGWEDRVADAALVEAARKDVTDAVALCHLDFHPLNVLAKGRDISALLDCRNAAAGDPRADLGLTWALLEAAPLPPGLALRVTRVVLRRFTAGWREGYAQEAGHFPLTPLFQALGLAVYHAEFTRAAAEGRGWATEAHVARLGRLLEERRRAAGL